MTVKKHIFRLFVLLTFTFALSAETFTGKCVGVTDGDTISVMKAGKAVKIRLEGIDCPESGQDFGTKAKQFVSSLVFGKEVQVKEYNLDRYGRTVARVSVVSQDVSLELVRAGLAWHYKQYSSDQALAEAEEQARKAKNGLWSMPNPVPPWEWRHGNAAVTESSTPQVKAEAEPGVQVRPTAQPVYITVSGTKYHADGCRYLSKSKVAIALADAIAKGYGPCSVCNPPTADTATTVQQPTTAVKRESAAATTPDTGEQTVYVTRTGSKYHKAGCRYLSKSAIPMKLKEAAARYGPCGVCNPPRLNR